MQFYLILSHFNYSFVFIFSPPSTSDPYHGGIPARIVRRGGTHITIIFITGAVGDGGGFYLPLPSPRSKRLRHCQTPAIVVVVVMLEVAVVDVVSPATLASLTTLSLDLVTPPVGAQAGPPWPPPSWRRCDAGDRKYRTL